MKWARANVTLAAAMLCVAHFAGCTTKARSRAEAQKAYNLGQAQTAASEDAKKNGIAFTGPVLNPIVAWREGITLAEAIVAARWTGLKDPSLVVVTRAGERVELSPDDSVAAAQLPMEPGDQVELLP